MKKEVILRERRSIQQEACYKAEYEPYMECVFRFHGRDGSVFSFLLQKGS